MQSNKKGADARRLVDFSVEQNANEIVVHAHIPNVPEEEETVPAFPHWSYLSPLTFRVVRLLAQENWMSKEKIAARLDEAADSKLGPILTDLAERGILESSTNRGYHIAIPSEAHPETFRRAVIAWVDVNSVDANKGTKTD